VNGAAIYGTRPWAPEGAAVPAGRPIRYTCDAHRIYALVQGAPADSIELPGVIVPNGAVVTMLGNDRSLPFRATAEGLEIELPDHLPPAPVTVFAISRAD
jgi:hypothetical protein